MTQQLAGLQLRVQADLGGAPSNFTVQPRAATRRDSR